jgi:hypothetical protein
VTFPDGLFIELEEMKDTTIRQLFLILRNVLSSHPNYYDYFPVDETNTVDISMKTHFKLFLRGKLLLMDHTIEQSGLKDGDTLFLAKDPKANQSVMKNETPIPMIQPTVITNMNTENLEKLQKQMLEIVEKQLYSIENLSKDIK